MKPVSIRFLGRFELHPAPGGEERINGTKIVLLLAFLSMPAGKTHDRKRLSELLWPDREAAQGLASLRQSLWSLRKGLGEKERPLIFAERSSIRLDPDVAEVDSTSFEQLVRKGTKADLEQAVALYRGDFLTEFDLDDDTLAPFLFERRRLREMALSCLRTLIGMRAASDDLDGAVETARRALSFDPLQEDVHAAIIKLHRDSGRLGLARDQYDACRELLRRELGILPSPTIEDLRKSLSLPLTAAPAAEIRTLGAPQPQLSALAAAPALPARTWPRHASLSWGIPIIAAMAIVYLFHSARTQTTLPAQPEFSGGRPSLVVLPFDDVSPGSHQVDLSTGLTDDLFADLSKVSELFVIAPRSSPALTRFDIPPQKIAETMGVQYALKGTVRLSQGIFRITAELVMAKTGKSVWAKRYDSATSDFYDVQDDVVQRIADSLKVELSERERRTITRIPTRNLEAHDFFLRAEQQNAGLTEPASYRRSIAAYRRAIELDPNFAEAYAGYARLAAKIWRGDFNEIMLSAVARQEAYSAAGKALELDPENARAHEVLSIIQAVEGEHQIAAESANRAVDLQPSDAEAHTNLATVLFLAGDLETAAAEVDVARRLNPALSNDLRLVSASVAFARGRYKEAVTEFDAIRELVPRSELVLEHLAAAYAYLGDTVRAKETMTELKEVVPIANLGFYAVLRQNTGTPEQTTRLIEGLRLAGIPEWPFDDRRNKQDRLDPDELRAVSAGPVWMGKLANGVDFVQYFDRSGGFAYRSTTSLLTGHIAIHDGQLCQVIDGYLLNRPTCGYVYRTATAGGHPRGQFAYVSIDAVKYFSVSK